MIDSGSSSPRSPATDQTSDRVGVPSVTAHVALGPVTTSARSARRFVGRALHDAQVEPGVFETVVLLTSEVVTNAVLHACSPIDVTVEIGSAAVRVQVCDDLPGLSESPTVPVTAAWGSSWWPPWRRTGAFRREETPPASPCGSRSPGQPSPAQTEFAVNECNVLHCVHEFG